MFSPTGCFRGMLGVRRLLVCSTAYTRPTLLMMMMLELELAAWRKLNTGSLKHKFLRPCGVFPFFVLIGLVVNFKRKANFGGPRYDFHIYFYARDRFSSKSTFLAARTMEYPCRSRGPFPRLALVASLS